MKYTSTCLLLALLALPSSLWGQNVLLDEDFSGSFPPSAWTEDNNGNSAGWTSSGGMAYHDDYTGWNDNALITPNMDSSAMTNLSLHFIQDQVYASWRDSNTVEITLDGGITWQVVYDETGSNSTSGEQIDVSLATYLGQPSFSLSFHYTGDYANQWAVDDVLVNDGGSGGGGGGLNYEVTNFVSGGLALFHVEGAIPGSIITMAYSLAGPGPTSTSIGLVDLSWPIRRILVTPADLNGEVFNLFMMPSGITGLSVWTQALSEGPAGFELTNSLALVVQ
ncbi:MAG: hypothetical protein OTJ44_06650 [Planctomycetota bacterium]|nr:hypothetical protein [Planctomycetota bacterium]